MLALLEQLNTIQGHDRRVAALRREQTELPVRKERIRARLQEGLDALASAEADTKQRAADIHQLEVEVEALREKINRFRQQQLEIKTNEGYRALVHEIEAHQRLVREAEDRELELMEKSEACKAAAEGCRRDLETARGEVGGEVAELEAREERIGEELAQLEEERRRLIADVDPEWLGRYERILHHVGDYALVPVDNGNCGGCHMKLPAQVINDARRAQSITSCAFCGRLLYWSE